MPDWTETFPHLSPDARRRLGALSAQHLPKGAVLFRPGDMVSGFPLVLTGRVEVFLTGASGREILLYAVEPGQSCVQTTLGLLGDEPYSAEAITATASEIVAIPRPLFLSLMDEDRSFRTHVIQTFARRMHEVTRLLEHVAFCRVEARLARALLDSARDGTVQATHAELAARIGSAREVITRRLDAFARDGLVEVDRGVVRLCDAETLRQLAAPLA